MDNFIITFDNSGLFAHHSSDLYYHNFEQVDNKIVVVNEFIKSKSKTDLYLFFLTYDSIMFEELEFPPHLVEYLNSGIIKLVINRRGEFINGDDIIEASRKLNDLGIKVDNIPIISMNIGKKLPNEIGFDSQLAECSWRVPYVVKDINKFYFEDLETHKKEYKFICLNGTITSWRLLVTYEIFNRNLKKKSMMSMVNKCNDSLENMNSQWEYLVDRKLNKNELNYLKKLPILFDKTSKQLNKEIGTINPMLVDEDYILNLKKSYFSLITESDLSPFNVNNSYKITEKTYKAISYHPFIIVGGAGILKYLRKLGFKTFPELFDESYDEIDDNYERIKFILNEVERVCNMDSKKIHNIYVSMISKIEHNGKILKEYNADKIIYGIFKNINNKVEGES
jgi:hypothetical protein